MLAAISMLNAACCTAVLSLTAVKRRRFLARHQARFAMRG